MAWHRANGMLGWTIIVADVGSVSKGEKARGKMNEIRVGKIAIAPPPSSKGRIKRLHLPAAANNESGAALRGDAAMSAFTQPRPIADFESVEHLLAWLRSLC